MGLISRFGNWLDYMWSEKAVAHEVALKFEGVAELFERHGKRLDTLESTPAISNLHDMVNKAMQDNLILRDELNAIKALYKIGGTKNPQTASQQQKFDGSQPWKR